MSEPENFLSRWSRLKREQGRSPQPSPPTHAPAEPAVDLTALPSIESIVADSDVRQFLQAGVPAELTRAALRTAWIADPAIRNFIEIADNQWDFNAEGAIPGFGALSVADREAILLAMTEPSRSTALADASESAEFPAAADGDADLEPAAAAGHTGHTEHAGRAEHAGHTEHADAAVPGAVAEPVDTVAIAAISTSRAEEHPLTRPRIAHSHGGALPK